MGRKPAFVIGFAWLGLVGTAGLPAQALIVDAIVTPAGGGVFHYDVSITNDEADDVSIVSIIDAPVGDTLIDLSLAWPAGFFASYDPDLGFVDFIEDTDVFAVGATVGGFAFDSAFGPPGHFGSFEALTVFGDLIAGQVDVSVVPVPAAFVLLGLGLLALTPAACRSGRTSNAAFGLRCAVLLTAGAAGMWPGQAVRAASHSDAPLIKQDPQANITDVYTFIGTKYDDPQEKVLNVIVHVRPFSEPGDGVIYDRFADDARYSIHITDPSSGATMDRYDFRFSSVNGGLKNPNTILSYGLGTEAGPILTIGDARQNYTQTYTVKKNGTVIGTGLPVPPPNVGVRTTPGYNDAVTGQAVSGATNLGELDQLTAQAIRKLDSGEAVFAGPREDGFYADTSGIFDLLDPRIIADMDGDPDTGGHGQDGGGIDGFKGFNVLSYAIQIPVGSLTNGSYVDPVFSLPATGVGVYASVSRKRITLRRPNGEPVNHGPFVQVNRMGNPLFNEVLVALRDKDVYNRTSPPGDVRFETYALNPEVARLINLVLFGDPDGESPLPTENRTDIARIFIPDVIRVDTTTEPVRLPGQPGFSRLGILGSDIVFGLGGPRSGGWPNGRRLGDDVVDIALTALSGFMIDIGDNVNANDQVYNQVFPYSGTPHAGPAVNQRQAPP